MTTATTDRSPATHGDATSPGAPDTLAGDTHPHNPSGSSRVCELCHPTQHQRPVPLVLQRVTALLCSRHTDALTVLGKSAAGLARLRRQQQRDADHLGITRSPESWIATRVPDPMYWNTVDARQFEILRRVVVNTR